MDESNIERLQKLRAELAKDFRDHRGARGQEPNSGYDTNRIFELDRSLHLKPGFCWRLLTSGWVRFAGPYLFAVPCELREAAVPKPTEGPKDVPGALADFMMAVEGDDSAWSYLLASFLARDADELGAYHTGARFGDQTLVTSCPTIHQSSNQRQGFWSALFGKKSRPGPGWEWLVAQPQHWLPEVQLAADRAVVTFYTYKLYYGEALIRYTDTYRRGSYCPHRSVERIASGPAMIVT